MIPKSAHGTTNLPARCASQKQITQAILGLYDEIADKRLLQRRITLGADIYTKEEAAQKTTEQLDFFTAPVEKQAQAEELEREQARLLAMLEIKKKFGKNAIFRGMNLEEEQGVKETITALDALFCEICRSLDAEGLTLTGGQISALKRAGLPDALAEKLETY